MTGLLVHEWIARAGGAEMVLEQMAIAYPASNIFTLWNDTPYRFADKRVSESWLSRSPLRHSKIAALPFMPAIWRGIRMEHHDWVLASSHLFAHHVALAAAASGRPAYIYVHTPARYIWTPDLDRRGDNVLARAIAPLYRRLDLIAARSGSVLAANSKFIQSRIEDAWGRHSTVIYPPVRVAELQAVSDWRQKLSEEDHQRLSAVPKEYLLGASRFVPYKQLNRVIEMGEACRLPVVIAGSGPEERTLRMAAQNARVPVHIVSSPSDPLLRSLMQRAIAYVFPPVEDFGIMPVEAMALGTPTIVNSEGGASESVEIIKGGTRIQGFDPQNFRRSLDEALTNDMVSAKEKAREFSTEAFRRNLRTWMKTNE